MSSYEVRGAWYSPPDRGSTNGDWNWFRHEFQAEGDDAARQMVKEYLAKEYSSCEQKDFKNLHLIRYEEVDLATVFV
jgi:hypothetical protein